MNYKVIKAFRGAPDVQRVLTYSEGEILVENADFPMELISVALVEGWVKPIRATKKKSAKAK